ncbi:copper amine oxidase N-terminal domain-containing protein [Saccharibacillus alkalitolerans]|uniref:Copper amine oxidase N-terminal domain-containing protein n=1 Tax=Saccharibacillus alkalitolerans TaxID=2705290 RepID=A0ABX0EZH9_9BACL|nr:stalk domain-containing protein [Saccharibacillus alkalitolerans]NGZ74152.1 copper amine oxidase N-terminal domain-containing protein [Saccharibacillus alkalitolerans]
MNLKKITIIALLVVVQAAAVLPSASAQTASASQDGKQAVVRGEVVQQDGASKEYSEKLASPAEGAAADTNSKAANSEAANSAVDQAAPAEEQPSQDEQTPAEEASSEDGSVPAGPQAPADGSVPADGTAGTPAEEGTNGNTNAQGSVTPVQTPTQTPASSPAFDPSTTLGTDKLVLMINGNKMYQNGQTYTAAQPMTAKNGVSYIAVRSFVNRVGLKLTYDAKTKETVITKGADELRFKLGTDTYTVNGVPTKMKGASYQQKNTFMVPLTSITQALGIPYKIDYKAKTITLSLSIKPTASFTVEPKEIVAGETQVTYTTKSESPSGYAIVNERWEGRQDVFTDPGTYVITYSVQDAKGQWSDPYTQTVTVEAPNQPPVAQFVTDKDTYRLGEPVTYTDQSYDPDGTLPEANSRVWENQKGAYFTPGPQTITLTVTDEDGATDTVSKTITITDEVLYTQDEYNALFVPIGSKFLFDGGSVPSMQKVARNDTLGDVTLYRSNSPESVYGTGKLYEDTLSGKVRFMVHHANYTGQKVMMYVVATNNNATPTTIRTLDSGFGGPSPFATAAGKVSVQRYHQSMINGNKKSTVTLQPGESKIILTDLNAIPMANKTVISLIADVESSQPITYSTLMIDPSLDPFEATKTLTTLKRDGVHNRGTYPLATKIIDVFEPVGGSTPTKLVIGDNKDDLNLTGVDAPNNTPESNAGNFGVLYKIHLDKVAPNTLITFNGRGGKYAGWITVNGQLVELSAASMGLVGSALNTSSEAGVVYRTGGTTETVDLEFTPAPGSNLSVNLIFSQMPARKE